MYKKIIVIMQLLLIASCGNQHLKQSNLLEQTSNSSPQIPEDTLSFLLGGTYVGMGLPVRPIKQVDAARKNPVFTNIINTVLETWFPLAKTKIFDGVGLAGVTRTGDNENLNYAFSVFKTPRGNKVFNFNCLYCHGETIGENTYIGLGNTTRDFTGDVKRIGDIVLAGALAIGTPEEKEEASILQHRFAIASAYMQSSTVGANPSVTYVYALMAHRDPKTLKWTDQRLLEMPEAPPLPVAVPAWWQMHKRKTLFASGELPFHWGYMTLATLMGQESPEQFMESAEGFQKVQNFIKTLRAPKYPLSIKQELAEQGQDLFNKNCSTCHGTYGSEASYPELSIPFSEIGTDRALGEQQTIHDERFVNWLKESPYSNNGPATPEGIAFKDLKKGYIAPPLDGIWATAPYFHNDCAPNLETALNSKQRPKYWRRSFDPKDYDVQAPGWKFETLTDGKNGKLKDKYIYDTRIKGYGCDGHFYGDKFSISERHALIEYLKSL